MSDPSQPSAPKLHIDSDWKAQAQAEKERLAKLEEERAKERGPRGGDPAEGEMPPADFKSLVGVLASQAMMGLGAYGDENGRVVVDLIGARFAIDLLGVLEEKTKGNLTADEAKDLSTVLAQLRSRFMQIATLVAQQMASRGGAAGGPGSAAPAGAPGAAFGAPPSIGSPAPRRPIIEAP
jgi:hypothetical protein